MQNVYDNEEFFKQYMELRNNGQNYNDFLEVPAFRKLLQSVKGLHISDLGCGSGENCVFYHDNGAARVVGIDISEKMIQKARQDNTRDKIEYYSKPIEEIDNSIGTFDVVVSSLAFHYIEDFDKLLQSIYRMLKPGGVLLFSQEHPIMTANKTTKAWIKDEAGNKLYWPVDNYSEDGKRIENWLVEGVIKYHRTMSTIINSLIDAGFAIERVVEPTAEEEGLRVNPNLAEVLRRPVFLIIKARK